MKYKTWYRIIYFSVALFAFYYVVKKLISFEQWNYVSGRFISSDWVSLLAVQIVLWVMNIGLETFRWQKMLSSFTNTGFFSSMQMVMMGFATGSVSPMKVGEPGGKVSLLTKDEKASGVLASVYGSYLNSILLFFIALVVLPFTISKKLIALPFIPELPVWSFVLIAFFIVSGSYITINVFFKRIRKQVRNTKWAVKHGFFRNFKVKEALFLSLLTLMRITVYNFQLFVWFKFFNITVPPSEFFLVSPLYFAAITLIPAVFLFDLGIRGSTGVFVFSVLTNNLGAILSALFFLWLVNVAVPVLWGSVLLVKNKTLKKDKNNDMAKRMK